MIAHLTSVHRPDDVRVFQKECVSLRQHGLDVVLIAPSNEPVANTHGVRLDLLKKRRSRLLRFTVTVAEVVRRALAYDAEVYHIHDSELLPAGLLLRLLGKKVIYDVHEDLAKQTLHRTWLPRWSRRPVAWLVDAMESMISRRLTAVVAATDSIAGKFDKVPTITVKNFPRQRLPQLVAEGEPASPACFVYAGSISQTRGMIEMAAAVNLLSPKHVPKLLIAGDVPGALAEQIARVDKLQRVKLLGWLPNQQIEQLLASATAGLVTLHPTPAYLDSLPIKMFEYMAAGLPVIASDFPMWKEYVEGCGAGLMVDPLDPHAIAEAMQHMIDHPLQAKAMGKRGEASVRRTFNWECEEAKLVALYASILQTPLAAEGSYELDVLETSAA